MVEPQLLRWMFSLWRYMCLVSPINGLLEWNLEPCEILEEFDQKLEIWSEKYLDFFNFRLILVGQCE